MLKLTTDRHEASRGLFATAELLVFPNCAHWILFLFYILTLKSVLEVIFRLLNDTLIIFAE